MGIGSSQASKKTGSLRKAAGCLRRHSRRAGTGRMTRLARPLSAPRRTHLPRNQSMREVELGRGRCIAVRCLRCECEYSLSRRVRKVAQEHACPNCGYVGWTEAFR